jgi:hypothetical protein
MQQSTDEREKGAGKLGMHRIAQEAPQVLGSPKETGEEELS